MRTLIKFIAALILIGGAAVVALSLKLQSTVVEGFEGKKWSLAAEVYSRPMELYDAKPLSTAELENELYALGYRYGEKADRPGTFAKRKGVYSVYTRGFTFWDGKEAAEQLSFRVSGGRVAQFRAASKADVVRLDPLRIGGIYPDHKEDRIVLGLDAMPKTLVAGLIAVEDRSFYSHIGVSPTAIVRAMIANIKKGAIVQGGSTISQQLIRNFFLHKKQVLSRKAQEALMAILMELRYSKDEILETYLNEIYLGQNGDRAVHGFALASRHYFSKDLAELRTDEIALLVALVKGASYYSPTRYPKRALARRNLVLRVMADQGVITEKERDLASARPLGIKKAGSRTLKSRYPDYMSLVKTQLSEEYSAEDLKTEGLRIFTYLDPYLQRSSEEVLAKNLAKLDKFEKSKLEGAVVLSKVGSGHLLAIVGSRKVPNTGFNRAINAKRQIGSLIKPALYLTAFREKEPWHLASLIKDTAVNIQNPDGTYWSPRNYDGSQHHEVTVYDALIRSYNLAAIHTGLDLGYKKVGKTLKDLGVERKIPRLPSLFLGSLELSPMQVTSMYQTIATGGFSTPLRTIHAVVSRSGKPIKRYGSTLDKKIASPPIHLIQHGLLGTMREGTGRGAYRYLPKSLNTAGKTGTTNDYRDAWFAGFTGNILGVVWVGKDDNKPMRSRLTGSTGALPIWSQIIAKSHPRSLRKNASDEVEYHWVHMPSGTLSSENCGETSYLPFVKTKVPQDPGPCPPGSGAGTSWFHSFFN